MKNDNLIFKEETKKIIRDASKNPETKVCFIFGAGASYGYSESAFYAPPIVKELFEKTNPVVVEVMNYPQHESIRDNLSHFKAKILEHNDDLEEYLSYLYNGSTQDTIFCDVLNYLQDIFFLASERFTKNNNNYMKLISQIVDLNRSKNWSFLSFNYDTIFEKSYLVSSRDQTRKTSGFKSLEIYQDVSFPVLKLHGSINYRYKSIKQFANSDAINNEYNPYVFFSEMMDENIQTGNFSKFIEVIDPEESKPSFYSHNPRYNKDTFQQDHVSVFDTPLMLIPIHSSINPENNFFRDVAERAKKEIAEASIIISIGYNFADKSFTNLLSSLDFSNKLIIIVDKYPTIETSKAVKNLTSVLGQINIKLFDGDGFDEFVKAIS